MTATALNVQSSASLQELCNGLPLERTAEAPLFKRWVPEEQGELISQPVEMALDTSPEYLGILMVCDPDVGARLRRIVLETQALLTKPRPRTRKIYRDPC